MVWSAKKRLTRLLISAVCCLCAAATTASDSDPKDDQLTDQQVGMQENLEDSVPASEQPTHRRWVPETIRIILPENLREMHQLEVAGPEREAASDSASGASGSDDSSSDQGPEGGSEKKARKLLGFGDRVLDISRLPLTYIQEKVPFLTKRQIIFFGRLEPEGVKYTGGVLADDSGFQLRRFRVGLAGKIVLWPDWNYKVEVDLTDGENTLSDTYISWHSNKWGTVRIGNQKVAQTLSGSTSSISIPFMERPLPVLAFSLQRRLGIGYHLHFNKMGGNATIFSTDLNENVGSQGYAGRFYYNPTSSETHVLHVGASWMKFSTDEDARIRARPESNLTNIRLVDTGIFPEVDTGSTTGLELAGSRRAVTIRSEFYLAQWGGKDSSKPKFHGWYVEGSWFLTGEMAHYRQGKFIRPRILSETGAWELAMRFSTIDLNDNEVEGGTEDNLSFGVNWYSKTHWRLMANAIKIKADGPEGKQDPWILQFRVQYYF